MKPRLFDLNQWNNIISPSRLLTKPLSPTRTKLELTILIPRHQLEESVRCTNIFVATDGSEIAGRAASHATELAQRIRARLLIVTITEPFHFLSLKIEQLESTRPEYKRHMAEHAQTVLASAAKIASEAGVECQIFHRSAEQPYAAILNVANDRGCDLIVVGSHGRSGLSSLVLGSTTMKILAHSTIPILVVR